MKDNCREQTKKDRQVDNLINTVEKHTRTKRHLEQYSEIGDIEFKEMARNKQAVREKQINDIKDQLVGVDKALQTKDEHLDGVKTRYEFAEGYMEKNIERMSEEDLKNLKKKQANRRVQIKNLEENINK